MYSRGKNDPQNRERAAAILYEISHFLAFTPLAGTKAHQDVVDLYVPVELPFTLSIQDSRYLFYRVVEQAGQAYGYRSTRFVKLLNAMMQATWRCLEPNSMREQKDTHIEWPLIQKKIMEAFLLDNFKEAIDASYPLALFADVLRHPERDKSLAAFVNAAIKIPQLEKVRFYYGVSRIRLGDYPLALDVLSPIFNDQPPSTKYGKASVALALALSEKLNDSVARADLEQFIDMHKLHAFVVSQKQLGGFLHDKPKNNTALKIALAQFATRMHSDQKKLENVQSGLSIQLENIRRLKREQGRFSDNYIQALLAYIQAHHQGMMTLMGLGNKFAVASMTSKEAQHYYDSLRVAWESGAFDHLRPVIYELTELRGFHETIPMTDLMYLRFYRSMTIAYEKPWAIVWSMRLLEGTARQLHTHRTGNVDAEKAASLSRSEAHRALMYRAYIGLLAAEQRYEFLRENPTVVSNLLKLAEVIQKIEHFDKPIIDSRAIWGDAK